jgi:CheY-like chemotaxis protein
MPTRQALVVDDAASFRRLISSGLAQRLDFQISEASDGWEAVQKAQQIQPELILLDVGLPTLNGIEAAVRIRKLSPSTRILFVSQWFSSDVVCEALRLGAAGYIHKVCLGRDLEPAIEAVLKGAQFVSGRFSQDAGIGPERSFRHEALFYSSDNALAKNLADSTCAALESGNAAIVALTEIHWRALLREFAGLGFDPAVAREEGRFLCLDATATLKDFAANGIPELSRFTETVNQWMHKLDSLQRPKRPSLMLFGEVVALLWARGDYESTLRLEQFWNELASQHSFSLHCAYPMGLLDHAQNRKLITSMCPLHSELHSLWG